jgi:hypothetical protein
VILTIIFIGLTARRLYKSFGVKGLITVFGLCKKKINGTTDSTIQSCRNGGLLDCSTLKYVRMQNASKLNSAGMTKCNELWPEDISSTVYMKVIWNTLLAAIVSVKLRWMWYWYVILCGPPLSVEERIHNYTDKQRCVGSHYQSTEIRGVEVTLCWPPFTVDESLI